MSEVWKGVQGVPSRKLAALDATGQAEEGYNIVTYENETYCDLMHSCILVMYSHLQHLIKYLRTLQCKYSKYPTPNTF